MIRAALAWWYAPHEARFRVPHEDDDMVTNDSPKERVRRLLDWALPILCDIHPMAGMLVRSQAEGILDGVSDARLIEQAQQMRDVCTYIIEGGAFPVADPA